MTAHPETRKYLHLLKRGPVKGEDPPLHRRSQANKGVKMSFGRKKP